MRVFLSELRLYVCNNWVNRVPSHSFRIWFYKNVMKFKIGKHSFIYMRCIFDSSKGLVLGDHSVINANCRIDCRGGIIIGENVSISSDVTILTGDHDMNTLNFSGFTESIIIEDYVFVGTRALILPGLVIGRGAIIAAGAVVTKDVTQCDVVAGIPAKKIKQRPNSFDYILEYKRLLQ